jgi:hypothetical protein
MIIIKKKPKELEPVAVVVEEQKAVETPLVPVELTGEKSITPASAVAVPVPAAITKDESAAIPKTEKKSEKK